MRHFIRPLTTLITFIVGLTAVAVWSGLRQSSLPFQSNEAISVTASPAYFFGWQKETQPAARDDAENDRLASLTYIPLESWDTADESQSDQIDVVYYLENRGSRSVDLMVLAVGDFKISPYGQIAGPNGSLRNPTLLTERQNIGQQVIRDLAPGETRQAKFTSFNLRPMIDKYLRKEYGTLRPGELRVNIDVRTLDNRQVAQQQGRLGLTIRR